MGERKVLNKYYPPDFNPELLPRGRKLKDEVHNGIKVRMMMPMSVRCNTCGEYIYKGKKFNARKETVNGEEYLGMIKVFRLYMRCPKCAAEFAIKTDPEKSDYVAELNCSRNFEGWREKQESVEEAKRSRQEEDENDAMKALENRTLDSKIEMDIIDALEEIKSLNAKTAGFDKNALIQYYKEQYLKKMNAFTEDDEDELNNVVFKSSKDYVQRIDRSVLKGFDDSDPLTDAIILKDEVVDEAEEDQEQKKIEQEKKKTPKRPNIVMHYDFEGGESGGGMANAEDEGNKKKPKKESQVLVDAKPTSIKQEEVEEKVAVEETKPIEEIVDEKKEEKIEPEKPKEPQPEIKRVLTLETKLSINNNTEKKKVIAKPLVKVVSKAKASAAPVKLVDY